MGHVQDKRHIRTTVLRRLKTQPEEDRRRKSEAIGRKLAQLDVFRTAKVVCCYVSLAYEVETRQLIAQMLATGQRVIVPRLEARDVELCELRDPATELAPGAFGVPEPSRDACRRVDPGAVDLVLVPGIAFDRRGHRLGHGGGYFDRLLSRLPRTTCTVGLCFDFQLLDHLPTDPHDHAVQTVISA